MTKENKKDKFVRILSKLAEERQKRNKRSLSEHDFYIDGMKKQTSLFDHLLFRAIMEQAEGLSLTFNKPHSYQVENGEAPRLSREAYETLEKTAILRPTRMGALCLIS